MWGARFPLHPAMVLGELSPDAVVVGEGEITTPRLISEGLSPDISGIAYMGIDGMVYTGPSPPSSMARSLPLVPPDIRKQNVRGANVYIETHRGCIGGCGFCQVARYFGQTIRSRNSQLPRPKGRGLRLCKNSGHSSGWLTSHPCDSRIYLESRVRNSMFLAPIRSECNVYPQHLHVKDKPLRFDLLM